MAQSASDNPSFVCHSGKLLWGQLHCIVEGHLANSSIVPSPVKGGTIIQHNFKYVVNAARGQWNVKDIIARSQTEDVAGFIIYNKNSADPAEILKDCVKLGMRSSRDKRIVYINRYDWSWAHEIPHEPEQLLYENLNDDLEQKVRNMMGKRIILADASAGLAIINQFKQKLTVVPKNTLIKDALVVENEAVGVHLAVPDTEYELGWMVFSASNENELIAFVYDGAYSGLEGDISLRN